MSLSAAYALAAKSAPAQVIKELVERAAAGESIDYEKAKSRCAEVNADLKRAKLAAARGDVKQGAARETRRERRARQALEKVREGAGLLLREIAPERLSAHIWRSQRLWRQRQRFRRRFARGA